MSFEIIKPIFIKIFMKYNNAITLHYMSKYFHNYTIILHMHFTFCIKNDFTLYSYYSGYFLIFIIPVALIID